MTSLETKDLKEAALWGDVNFLKKCVATNKPIDFYVTFFPKSDDQSGKGHYGNILHMAAMENRDTFIREVIGMLPKERTHQLLIQSRDEHMFIYPLHIAAFVGNIEIVKMFLEVYRSLPSDLEKVPWLLKNSYGNNPCFVALSNEKEEIALVIFNIDPEQLCHETNGCGSSLLYEAILYKMSKLALEIFRSSGSCNCAGPDSSTALHVISRLECSEEAKEICRGLLQRDAGLTNQTRRDGISIFNEWAKDGKLWPYECVLESIDIIPDGKKVVVDLISQTDKNGSNPLHNLVLNNTVEEGNIEIAKLLVNFYKKEASGISSSDQLPWTRQNNYECTPLSFALYHYLEKYAKYMLLVDANVVTCSQDVLFLAISNGCHEVAENILEIIENQGWSQLLTNKDQKNVLHRAPLCKEDFCIRLIEGYPEFIKGVDNRGNTVLHSWMSYNPKPWLFEYILKSQWRSSFVKLISTVDYMDRNNPIHAAATHYNEATKQVVELLVEAYNETGNSNQVFKPWFTINKANQGPLHVAISNRHETCAMYILSLLGHESYNINILLDYYEPKHSTLFLAIQNGCFEVAKQILEKLDKNMWTEYLKNPSNGQNILHLATELTDVQLGTWLVNEASQFISEQDDSNQSPWDKAYEVGATWFIEAVLEKDPSVFNKEPLCWTKACEKGHVLALGAYINHDPGAFRDLCIESKDSPLHHIHLKTLTKYEEFLKYPYMKDMINLQNSQGETPLHQSIRRTDKFLTEVLLNMDQIIYDIKDATDLSAIELMAQKCREAEDKQTWERICKRIELDPSVQTTYFHRKTNLLEVRTSLFVVAALLATITFTAGFTLPGGFDQNNGEAVLGKKASFLVFLIFDTLALFFSMLVLICLTWSMVYSSSQSLVLIDRSMVLLRIALNCTLVSFMTGVYVVMAPKSLWAAVLIIVIMSSLIGISVSKTILNNLILLDKFVPTPKKKPKTSLEDPELGISNEQDHLHEA